ncbi:response regulator transcription factor [Puteibacter caeruleilacunae]|nr:response regulator transcription factor [Puteibacter caeruleilacunae]
MRVAIIEDELYAYKELVRMLKELIPDIEIVAHFDSVKSAIDGLYQLKIDLAFFDISLPDGFSFEILNDRPLQVPIIFTTAYDEYSLRAFKYHSVDYLLKPIDSEELKAAIDKYRSIKEHYSPFNLEELVKSMQPQHIKKRFLIKIGDKYTTIKTPDIAYFYSEDKVTYIRSYDGQTYLSDYSLNDIESLIGNDFFRVSRNMICSLDSIESTAKYFNSRLKIQLNPPFQETILLSRVRVKEFLKWLDS